MLSEPKPRYQCKKCGLFMGSKWFHHLECKPRKVLLTLDNRSFFCHLGCRGRFTLDQIKTHMLDFHSETECWWWGINKDILRKECLESPFGRFVESPFGKLDRESEAPFGNIVATEMSEMPFGGRPSVI